MRSSENITSDVYDLLVKHGFQRISMGEIQRAKEYISTFPSDEAMVTPAFIAAGQSTAAPISTSVEVDNRIQMMGTAEFHTPRHKLCISPFTYTTIYQHHLNIYMLYKLG